MKKYIIGLTLSLISIAVSCSIEEMLPEHIGQTEQRSVSILAIMENEKDVNDTTATRSLVDATGKFSWAAGDAIGVWLAKDDGTGVFSEFVLDDESAGKAEGYFSGTVNEVETISEYAVYPYSVNHRYENGRLTLHLPAVYGDFGTEYSPNTHAIMIADIDGALPENENSSKSFRFNHLAGVLCLTLEYVPSGAAQVVFTSNNGITGDFEISGDAQEDRVINVVEKTESNSSVTIRFKPLASAHAGEMRFHFPLPVGTYEGFTVALQDKEGNGLWSRSVTATNSISCRTLSSLPKVSCMDKEAILQLERQALIDLYNSTNGANWTDKENWCSDKPVGEWYGITTNEDGYARRLNLYYNQLTGQIPESIGNLTYLYDLRLYGNKLSGSIPESIGNLTNLYDLYLGNNQLSGSIPESIGNLTNLGGLDLSSNQLSGSIPESIGNLTNLEDLWLNDNQLSGSIPESIGNLTYLTDLWLNDNQLSGSIPASIGNLTYLTDLRLYNNQLSGFIPESLGNLTNLTNLHLYNNQLSGPIPESIGSLTNLYYLYLYNNQLSGSIPESIRNLTNLVWLALYSNQLSGSIPESIGNLTNLYYLYLNNNQLSGSIPESIVNLTNLGCLNLNSNQLSGSIPESIGNLTNLYVLYLDNNKLSGSIPESIGDLTNLDYLYLNNNQLSGTISDEMMAFFNGILYFDISGNNFDNYPN